MDIEYLAEKTATDAIKRYLDNKKTPTNQHIILDEYFLLKGEFVDNRGLRNKSWYYLGKLAKEIARENGFSLKNPKDFQKPSYLPLKVSNFLTEINKKGKIQTTQQIMKEY